MKLIDDTIDFRAWYEAPVNGVKIRKASEFAQDLETYLFRPRDTPRIVLSWERTYGKFEFRSHEMSVWAGPNGQGKSMLTTQVALDLCMQGETVCIASIEMKPYKTLQRMAAQAYGGNELAPRFIKDFSGWTDDKLWMYDHVGSVDPQEMIGVVRFAAMEMGIKHFFIDNLQKCIANEDDYNGQKAFCDALFSIAKDTGIHVHLVHHTRKTDGTPRKQDIKGASSITDLVDNVFLIYRNTHKEAVLDGIVKVAKQADYDRIILEPDVFLELSKQRHAEFEGIFGLWKSHECPQFLEERGGQPKRYRIEAATVDLSEAF
jgi:twinkle protein